MSAARAGQPIAFSLWGENGVKTKLAAMAAALLLAACSDEPEVVVVDPASNVEDQQVLQGDGIDPREDVDAVVTENGVTVMD